MISLVLLVRVVVSVGLFCGWVLVILFSLLDRPVVYTIFERIGVFVMIYVLGVVIFLYTG